MNIRIHDTYTPRSTLSPSHGILSRPKTKGEGSLSRNRQQFRVKFMDENEGFGGSSFPISKFGKPPRGNSGLIRQMSTATMRQLKDVPQFPTLSGGITAVSRIVLEDRLSTPRSATYSPRAFGDSMFMGGSQPASDNSLMTAKEEKTLKKGQYGTTVGGKRINCIQLRAYNI